MGLQLSILIGCVGALELLACLKHVFVCVLRLTDQPTCCYIDYFHRSKLSEDFVIANKSNVEENKRTCSEIEAILRENRSEPDILCIGPPPAVDDNLGVPTTTSLTITDELTTTQKITSNRSSLVDSGNDNPVIPKTDENLPSSIKRRGSSSDVSSLAETEAVPVKTTPKKILRRSKTPEVRGKDYDDYDDEEEDDVSRQKKHQSSKHKSSKGTSAVASRKSMRLKSKNTELGRSAENLSTVRRSKRQREPERCKSDIQIQVARKLQRDEWTNTSPMSSDVNLSRASSKRSISVLIQTSFEDKLHYPENNGFQNFDPASKLSVCPNCHCCGGSVCRESSKVRQVTETKSVDGKPQLVKISSFEHASEDDYEKLKGVIGNGHQVAKKGISRNWSDKIKSSIESESYDEYLDAEDEGLQYDDSIQYSIPDPGDSKAFWVISRPR